MSFVYISYQLANQSTYYTDESPPGENIKQAIFRMDSAYTNER